MPPVLIVTHLEDRHTGLVRGGLEQAGCSVLECSPFDQVPLAPLNEISGIVSLGGRWSATAIDRHPFLAAEVELLRAALAARVPILGICLGAQLLAVAAGGRVAVMERMYAGWPPLSMLSAARDDAVFGGLPSGLPVLEWHEDLIEAPPQAVALGATLTPGEALFRIGGSAWGSQMHLELTPAMLLDGWLTEPSAIVEIEAAGHDIGVFRAQSSRCLQDQVAAMRPVLARFAGVVTGRAAGAHGPVSHGTPPSAGRWTATR